MDNSAGRLTSERVRVALGAPTADGVLLHPGRDPELQEPRSERRTVLR
jgi:hypothetical protein